MPHCDRQHREGHVFTLAGKDSQKLPMTVEVQILRETRKRCSIRLSATRGLPKFCKAIHKNCITGGFPDTRLAKHRPSRYTCMMPVLTHEVHEQDLLWAIWSPRAARSGLCSPHFTAPLVSLTVTSLFRTTSTLQLQTAPSRHCHETLQPTTSIVMRL